MPAPAATKEHQRNTTAYVRRPAATLMVPPMRQNKQAMLGKKILAATVTARIINIRAQAVITLTATAVVQKIAML